MQALETGFHISGRQNHPKAQRSEIQEPLLNQLAERLDFKTNRVCVCCVVSRPDPHVLGSGLFEAGWYLLPSYYRCDVEMADSVAQWWAGTDLTPRIRGLPALLLMKESGAHR